VVRIPALQGGVPPELGPFRQPGERNGPNPNPGSRQAAASAATRLRRYIARANSPAVMNMKAL
jgi:hypothetical protein